MHQQPIWPENDQLFRQQLEIGHRYATIVATYLCAQGLTATTSPMFWRNDITQTHLFDDEWDVTANNKRLDVKSRSLSFTSVDDYPYSSVFVYSRDGWDAKTHKPHAVILISQLTEAMLVIPPSSFDHWWVETRYDNVRQLEHDFYMAPTSVLRPIEHFVQWLRTCR